VLGAKCAATLLRKVEFHYIPLHAHWLDMAEIEILQRHCLARCAAEQTTLAAEVAAWQRRRNAARSGIGWRFTRRDGPQVPGPGALHRGFFLTAKAIFDCSWPPDADCTRN